MEAAFFDLDKTVIARASMVAFGRPFYRHGLISRRLLARGLWGQLVYLYLGADEERLARMRESVLTLTKGWQQSQVRHMYVLCSLHRVPTALQAAPARALVIVFRSEGLRRTSHCCSKVAICPSLNRTNGNSSRSAIIEQI